MVLTMAFFKKPSDCLFSANRRELFQASFAAIGFAICSGCGSDGPDLTSNNAAPQNSHNPDLSRTVYSSDRLDTPLKQVSDQADSPQAQELLSKMFQQYRQAKTYSDDGRVELRYKQNGVDQVDSAPLAVRYESPDRLAVRAYGLEMACRGGQLTAQIHDVGTENWQNQRLRSNLPPGPFTLDDLYADPLLVQFATAGLGGPPPQLELLFGENPLLGLLEGNVRLTLDRPVKLDGRVYSTLRISGPATEYVLWIDPNTFLLRRIDLPLSSVPGLSEDVSIQNPRLSIDLRDASFTAPSRTPFQLSHRQSTVDVPAFIPLPPAIANPMLGQNAPAFTLDIRSPQGQGLCRVSQQGSDRPITVLLWVARHSGSEAAAQELHQLAGSLPAASRDATRFVIVMAEDGPPTGQTLQQWNTPLPWVDDRQAIGRDLFRVETAPTLCVLGRNGELEWFQHRVEPGALHALPQVIQDLLSGVHVGRSLQEEHAANLQAYQQALQSAIQNSGQAVPPK